MANHTDRNQAVCFFENHTNHKNPYLVNLVLVVLSISTPTTKIHKLVNMVSVVLPKPTPTTKKSINWSIWSVWFFQNPLQPQKSINWSIWSGGSSKTHINLVNMVFGIRGYVGEKMPATCFAVSRNGTGRDEQAAFGITTCLVRVEEEAFAVELRRDLRLAPQSLQETCSR